MRCVRAIPDSWHCPHRELKLAQTSQPLSVDQALHLAISHHRAGRIPQAEAICLQVLQVEPNQPVALHMLGMLAHQAGKSEIALERISRAIRYKPSDPILLFNLGAIYTTLNRLDEAMACFQKALALKGDFAEAHNNLGNIFDARAELAQAADCYQKAVTLRPDFAEAHYNLGRTLSGLGRIDEAIACYQKSVAFRSDFAEAHNNLGLAMHDKGDLDAAVACYRKALALKPDYAEAHNNLGRTLEGQRKLDEAIASYEKALAIKPDFAEAHNNLGNVFDRQGDLDKAIARYRKAIALKPDYAEAYNNLGLALAGQGKIDDAIACYQKALILKPDYAEANSHLGNAFHDKGEVDAAVACYRKALALKPEFSGAHNNLGRALASQRKLGEAVACYRRALALQPDFALAQNNLGNTLRERGELDEAVSCCLRAIELEPDFAEAHSNLGNALKDQGKLSEAIACYRKALELKPDFGGAYGNLLFALQYDAECSPSELFEEHRRFAQRFEVPLEPLRQAFGNTREPERRLKIGYVSADFRRHSVAYFIEPVLASHDKSGVEVFCYYSYSARDEITERIIAHADHWIPCAGMTDDELAARIRADGIDILVDLAGHTAGNRLLVFARKPAPVQVTWLGYPSTTGLSAIDYRITDRHAEPPGMTEQYSIEKLWRLDDMFCVYRPCAVKPERRHSAELAVRQTPAMGNGHITFGSINNIAKITPAVIAAWAKILHAVPGAGLLLETAGFDGGDMRADFEARFAAHGITRERLLLLERKPEQQYVLYHRIDIALDPFPCNGGTNTCDALWMGVPVIALAGTTFASRMGVTMVSNAGHPEWAARDEDDYLRLACELASDAARLNAIRLGLRDEVERSPLRDEAGFTHSLETAYRQMWQAWCNSTTESEG
jgi:protein O-GlcNAc transferase